MKRKPKLEVVRMYLNVALSLAEGVLGLAFISLGDWFENRLKRRLEEQVDCDDL